MAAFASCSVNAMRDDASERGLSSAFEWLCASV
jgi:hypothetical protein